MKKGWDFYCPWHKRMFPESKLFYCKDKKCKHYLTITKKKGEVHGEDRC